MKEYIVTKERWEKYVDRKASIRIDFDESGSIRIDQVVLYYTLEKRKFSPSATDVINEPHNISKVLEVIGCNLVTQLQEKK